MFNPNKSNMEQLRNEIAVLADAFENRGISRREALLSIGDFFWCSNKGYCAYAAYQLAGETGKVEESIQRRLTILEQSPFFGKMCVVTGVLSRMEREFAFMEIEQRGGRVSDKPVNSMEILILGYQEWSELNGGVASRKVQKAVDLQQKGGNIKIISEDEFYAMLDTFY